MAQNHIIRTQLLEIDFHGTEADAMILPNRISELCNTDLGSALDNMLGRDVPDDVHVLIERLEITINNISFETLERELLQAVIKELGEKLVPMITEATHGEVALNDERSHVIVRNDGEHFVQAMRRFMQTGQLPWSFQLPKGTRLERFAFDYLQLEPVWWPRLADALRPIIASSGNAQQRFISQFTESFRLELLGWMSPRIHSVLMLVLYEWRRSNVSPIVMRTYEEKLWLTVLRLFQTEHSTTVFDVVQHATTQVVKTVPLPTSEAIAQKVKSIWPEIEIRTTPVLHKDEHSSTNEPSPKEEPLIEDSMFVENAGVVLLHPFLPMFFKALGIADDSSILQPDNAVALLHYLATGEENVPEYELVVSKLLCGIDINEPVQIQREFSTEVSDESTALLEAVVRHWSALRSTSADGLRDSFLRRSGKLSTTPNGEWLLKIETQTYDILLDHLPWGISMIQLPWMQSMLRVEWNS